MLIVLFWTIWRAIFFVSVQFVIFPFIQNDTRFVAPPLLSYTAIGIITIALELHDQLWSLWTIFFFIVRLLVPFGMSFSNVSGCLGLCPDE
jgi:hypothetical protein